MTIDRVWFKASPYDHTAVTAAIEAGITTFLVENGESEKIRQLARVTIAGKDGDLKEDKDFYIVDIRDKEQERRAAQLGKDAVVVVSTPDWEIIPLENLIAAGARVYWKVPDYDKALLSFSILEKGTEGIVLECADPGEIKKFSRLLRGNEIKFSLEPSRIVSVQPVGMADRVCVDTGTEMRSDQGMLAGNSSAGMLLVQAETTENPYVASRPFRVNLSAVHAYTPLPDGRTCYLSELSAGMPVVIVDTEGRTETAVVGRVKIERRPMLMVTYVRDAAGDESPYSMMLQNAETVRLLGVSGDSVSMANIQPGDLILGAYQKAGRHFGMAIDEKIIEK